MTGMTGGDGAKVSTLLNYVNSNNQQTTSERQPQIVKITKKAGGGRAQSQMKGSKASQINCVTSSKPNFIRVTKKQEPKKQQEDLSERGIGPFTG